MVMKTFFSHSLDLVETAREAEHAHAALANVDARLAQVNRDIEFCKNITLERLYSEKSALERERAQVLDVLGPKVVALKENHG